MIESGKCAEECVIKNCLFEKNKAKSNYGGAIAFFNSDYFLIENCNFKNNYSAYFGGKKDLFNQYISLF